MLPATQLAFSTNRNRRSWCPSARRAGATRRAGGNPASEAHARHVMSVRAQLPVSVPFNSRSKCVVLTSKRCRPLSVLSLAQGRARGRDCRVDHDLKQRECPTACIFVETLQNTIPAKSYHIAATTGHLLLAVISLTGLQGALSSLD